MRFGGLIFILNNIVRLNYKNICMILKGFEELCAPNELEYLTIVINNNTTTKKSNKRKIYELLFENCASTYCYFVEILTT